MYGVVVSSRQKWKIARISNKFIQKLSIQMDTTFQLENVNIYKLILVSNERHHHFGAIMKPSLSKIRD